ncbi:TadE/TadG family type IV pilus assembly protein [Desulfocurvus sp. DL9XJH121]
MRHALTSERGLAALEAALILPLLAGFLYFLVEGTTVIMTYSALSEASRVAARQVLLTGEDSGIQDLVGSLLPELNADGLSTSVNYEDSGNTVTVEISYDYQTLFSDTPVGETVEPLVSLVARTSMPAP